ncbi:aminopeptidase [Thermobrachium celere]|uniref:Aminopeptidase n=1 Tax=Thermobrachium celere DSM 8682 TaxID=941824 RepID=R7RNZ3_9CLOT|nr:aminopeptidase [Thermobrachium celere]CDF57779.1 Aminopeptidase [Thermobrachium celere DSM 8682]
MDDLKGKKIYFIFITILVIIILLSNLGQNFKTDGFSTTYALANYNAILSRHTKSKNYEEYLKSSTSYIQNFLKVNGLKQIENAYIHNYSILIPNKKHSSTLEVISKYGKVVKKYEYIDDYFEDYRGIISPGIYNSVPQIIDTEDLDKVKYRSSIALTDIYKDKSLYEIFNIDLKLKKIGISAVISPSPTNDLVSNSNLFNGTYYQAGEGLTKLIVSQRVFDELKYLASKGYEFKIKSGAEIKEGNLYNVYGMIEGKNKLYNPIIFAVFYDGEYKFDTNSNNISAGNFLPTSIMLEVIRAIQFQKLIKPDRTIVFAFLSGYNQNKYGLRILQNNFDDYDLILFEDIGSSNTSIINYSKHQKDLTSTAEYYLKKNQISILSKNIDLSSTNKYTNIAALSYKSQISTQYMLKWGKFMLDLVGNTCYNLDFLTGNFYKLRLFKNLIREYSAILSLCTLFLLIYTIFKRPKPLT